MATHIRQRQTGATWVVFLGIALLASSASAQIIIDNRAGPLPWQQLDNSRYDWMRGMDQASRSEALNAIDTLRDGSKKAHGVKAQEAEREFLDSLAEFTNAWNALMEVRHKGVWDAKKARQTRKAFARLVHSQGWVESSKK